VIQGGERAQHRIPRRDEAISGIKPVLTNADGHLKAADVLAAVGTHGYAAAHLVYAVEEAEKRWPSWRSAKSFLWQARRTEGSADLDRGVVGSRGLEKPKCERTVEPIAHANAHRRPGTGGYDRGENARASSLAVLRSVQSGPTSEERGHPKANS
jgi:hypothetical protein